MNWSLVMRPRFAMAGLWASVLSMMVEKARMCAVALELIHRSALPKGSLSAKLSK